RAGRDLLDVLLDPLLRDRRRAVDRDRSGAAAGRRDARRRDRLVRVEGGAAAAGAEEGDGGGDPGAPHRVLARGAHGPGRPCSRTSGTNLTAPRSSRRYSLALRRVMRTSSCWCAGPTGITRRPPISSWASSARGGPGPPAVTEMTW